MFRVKSRGFTMIELVLVIVILGILAATALPKFIDLRSNAIESAANGIAGNLGSAASVNYAACSALNHATPTTGVNANKCTKIDDCQDTATLLQGVTPTAAGAFTVGSTNYQITSAALATNGATTSCSMTATSGNAAAVTVTFMGLGAGN